MKFHSTQTETDIVFKWQEDEDGGDFHLNYVVDGGEERFADALVCMHQTSGPVIVMEGRTQYPSNVKTLDDAQRYVEVVLARDVLADKMEVNKE